ncbi:amidohydrolase [Sinomonas sp. JGH33]|uniref:Amidohydrolase n=1 Tax=Sinomonas terricola TaxID=3110330 RepID=A0ABU5T1W2_9MICC|nr:amidohydrolase [Sinomonas sp. JGH33]MEA5453537.1 amidohydrolase [Sinomonas sp. JGH33]
MSDVRTTTVPPFAPAGPSALAAEADHALVALEAKLVAVRRDVHAHPEVGFDVSRTASLMADELRDVGLSVRTGVGGAGVIADLDGTGPGPRLLVRAELDALPVREASGLAFAATGPTAHLCGHDVHLAAALGVATALAGLRHAVPGGVRFCLQPAEELLAGAGPMLADGVLDGIDGALGAHVLSGVPYGTVAINPGVVLSGADFFRATVSGGAGHAGTPGQFADAILAAAHITTALHAVVARETSPGELLVIGIGAVHGGDAANAAPEDVALLGNVRWLEAATAERATRRVEEVCAGVASALGCRAEIAWTGHAPVLANDPDLAAVAQRAILSDKLAEVAKLAPLTASDDFAEFSGRVPGLFLGIGCGGPGSAPHHHPRFEVDERAVLLAARVLCRALLSILTGWPAVTLSGWPAGASAGHPREPAKSR